MTRSTDRNPTAEAFYAAQWSTPEWNQRKPNRDEADRWAAMQPLVETALKGIPQPYILDLGCGRGWLTRLLAEHGETLGIDPLEASVEAARNLFPKLSFRCITAAELTAPTRSDGESKTRFHLVVASEVIEHVPHPDKPSFLAAARDLLLPGGHLLLTTPRGVFWKAWRRRAVRTQPVEEWLTEGELDHLAQEARLELVRRTRAHLLRTPLCWQGTVLKRILSRRFVRDLPLGVLRRPLEEAARFYQVGLWRKGNGPGAGGAALP